MIRMLEISNYTKPYDLNAFDWNQISGGWEKMRSEGLAGGVLAGKDVLGLGQAGEGLPIPEVQVVGQCDFSEGTAVEQIQDQLGVPVTGFFDEATCAAWMDEFGEPPTARSLEAATDAACASIVVPRCAALDERKPSSLPTYLIAGAAGLTALALVAWGRQHRR